MLFCWLVLKPVCLHSCTNWCADWIKASYNIWSRQKATTRNISFLKKILVLFFHILIKASCSNFTLTKNCFQHLDHDTCLVMKTLAQHRRQQHWLEKHECTELPSIMCWMAGYTNTVNSTHATSTNAVDRAGREKSQSGLVLYQIYSRLPFFLPLKMKFTVIMRSPLPAQHSP